MRPRKKPTIDERLDAITETLELVAGMQLTNEKAITSLAKAIERTEKNLDRLERLTKVMLISHEARIKKLERKG